MVVAPIEEEEESVNSLTVIVSPCEVVSHVTPVV